MSVTSARDDQAPGVVPGRRAAAPVYPARYGALLLLLIATYLLSAFITGDWVNAVQTLAFLAVLLLALRNGLVTPWVSRLLVGVVLAGSAAAIGLAVSHAGDVGIGVAEIWTGLVLLATVIVILRRVLAAPTVTLQSIFGALSAYMILGLMFAAFYGSMNKLGGTPFFANGQPDDTKTFQYFSFTTLTTLGYGDFTAASNAGRAVAVMEAMVGQIFLATLVARLVSAFRPADRH